MRPHHLALALAVLGSWPFAATPALADAAGDAADHVRRGIELRRTHQNAEALAEFEEAYALAPTPRARAQVALAELALGRWVEAESGLVEALAAKDDPWIAKNHDILADALASIRPRVADLVVDASVAGAEVWVDGARRGVVPLVAPLRVAAGDVVVEVRAPRFLTLRRSVKVWGGESAHETFTLTAAERPLAAAPHLVRAEGSPPDSAGSGRRTAGWLTLGAGALALGAGATATVVQYREAGIYDDDSRCLVGVLTRDQQCGGHRDAAKTAQAVAIVGYSVSGVAAISGTILLLTSRAKPEQVGCSFGLSAITCGSTF